MAENINEELDYSSDNTIRIQDIMALCLHYWWWFVISVILCVGLATLYILCKQPVYTRTAQVLIKEDNSNAGNAADLMGGFSDFGFFSPSSSVNDELFSFQSPDVMDKVVDNLELNINYSTDDGLRKKTLYGKDLPVKVEFLDVPNNKSCKMTILNEGNGKAILYDFKSSIDEDLESKDVPYTFGDTVMTPVGKVVVNVIDNNALVDLEKIYVTKLTRITTVDNYLENLTVELPDENSHVISLSIKDVSPQRALDILNNLISVYNANWIRDKNQLTVSTSMFIKDRLGVIEDELGNVDSDISSFKSEHLLPDIGESARRAIEQASTADVEARNLEVQASTARYVRNYLVNIENRNQPLPLSSGLESLNITSQINEYNAKLLDRNSLAANSSERNPLVADIDKQLNSLRQALIATLDNQIVAINAQIRTTRNLASSATSKIASSPKQSKYLLSVERQQKVKEALYLYLLQKREENELSQAFTAYNTRIIQQPRGKEKPTAPVKRNVYLVAIVLGLMIPFGIIYLREMLNTKIRGRKDLDLLSLPKLGEIPQQGKAKHKQETVASERNDVMVKAGSRNMMNEAFRVVRTNLEFILQSYNNAKVIGVTSANPGSGKTFITYNLGISLAIKDKKVVIIDLDLRKASMGKYVGSPKTGVADYLVGKVNDVSSIICQATDASRNLYIVPVGTLPPNPTELLFSPRLASMIEELRNEYDYVFIDCPPVEVVADAAIINKLCDMTIFVIRAGIFERSMLSELENAYRTKKYRNMAVLLNGTDATIGKYGYKYGYRYGYSDRKYGNDSE